MQTLPPAQHQGSDISRLALPRVAQPADHPRLVGHSACCSLGPSTGHNPRLRTLRPARRNRTMRSSRPKAHVRSWRRRSAGESAVTISLIRSYGQAVEAALQPEAAWEDITAAITAFDVYQDRPWSPRSCSRCGIQRDQHSAPTPICLPGCIARGPQRAVAMAARRPLASLAWCPPTLVALDQCGPSNSRQR